MVERYIDGFEHYSVPAQFGRQWIEITSGGTQVAGRIQGFARQVNSSIFETRSFSTQNRVIVGFAFRCSTAIAGSGFSIMTGATEQIRFVMRAGTGGASVNYNWEAFRGAISLGVSGDFATNVWHYFEFDVTVRTGTNGSFEIRRNETVDTTVSSINTANNGTDGADVWRWSWTNSLGSPQIDDLYIFDGSGSRNNSYHGDSLIVGQTVTGAGTNTNWTPNQGQNWENVDDPSSPSDGTNTNQSDNTGDIDTFAMSDPTGIQGTITCVQTEIQLAMAAAGTRTVAPRFRDTDAAGEASGSNHTVDDTNFQTFTQLFHENPVATSAWTLTNINNGEWGYHVTG